MPITTRGKNENAKAKATKSKKSLSSINNKTSFTFKIKKNTVCDTPEAISFHLK